MNDPAGLADLKIPVQRVAPLTLFRTRAGTELGYRQYPAWSENLLFLIHGIAGDSRYLAGLASAIAGANLATVVTPDLRGHGTAPHGPRASVPKASQLEEDLEETLIHVRQERTAIRFAWGGHSLGGALALRLALFGGASSQTGLLLLAPYLGFAPDGDTFGGWISREGDGIHVNMPPAFRTGTEVLEYDRSFFEAATPSAGFADRLDAMKLKTRVLVADRDQVFPSSIAREAFRGRPNIQVTEVPASHLGLVANPAAVAEILRAVEELF